jgi:hypothetical protein
MPLGASNLGSAGDRAGLRSLWSILAWIVFGILIGGLSFYLLNERLAGAGVDRVLAGVTRLEPWSSPLPPGSAVVFRGETVATLRSRAAIPLAAESADSMIVFQGSWLRSQGSRSVSLDSGLVAYAPTYASERVVITLDSRKVAKPAPVRVGELWLRPMVRPIAVLATDSQ